MENPGTDRLPALFCIGHKPVDVLGRSLESKRPAAVVVVARVAYALEFPKTERIAMCKVDGVFLRLLATPFDRPKRSVGNVVKRFFHGDLRDLNYSVFILCTSVAASKSVWHSQSFGH